jgi:beta-fructofuranosidase
MPHVEHVRELIAAARELRAILQADRHRPAYHFVVPEGVCIPFDPNGAIFWKGRYHLFTIFRNELGHCWGHASSADLLHWVHHPTALEPGQSDGGIYSGNAFVSSRGVPMIAYAGIRAGVCLASADPSDDLLIRWTKHPGNPVIPLPSQDPFAGPYQVGDPYLWLEGDRYYCVTGAQSIPEGTGEALYLFESRDLADWNYRGRFFDRNPAWTNPQDDCSCAELFPLGDRWMLLCISHRSGCRCYLGRREGERFVPEEHHLMNWPGGTCFAPESLLDDRGRRIMWAWTWPCRRRGALDRDGWSGDLTLPRVLSMGGDGRLRIDPPEELEGLRLAPHHGREHVLTDAPSVLPEVRGDCLELRLEIDPGSSREVGVSVRRSPDGAEETTIAFLPGAGVLRIDTSRSTSDPEVLNGFPVVPWEERWVQEDVRLQEAPLRLEGGERLELRIFLDRSILEVYANRRQCVTQRIYPSRPDSLGVALFARGGPARVTALDAWQMAATNPW